MAIDLKQQTSGGGDSPDLASSTIAGLQSGHPDSSGKITPPERPLIRVALSNHPNVTMVQPQSFSTVDIPSAQDSVLFTFGLGGCTSILVASKDAQENFRATLTHYGPSRVVDHQHTLETESRKHLENGREPTAISVICVARGWTTSPSGLITLSENAQLEIDALRSTTMREFAGRSVNYQLFPYDSCFQNGSEAAGFIIRWDRRIIGNAVFEAHDEHSGVVFF